VVDLHTALGEQFLDIAVGEAETQYQRTATTITSGGKRKPTNADRGGIDGRERRAEAMAAVSSLGLPHRQCNSPGTQAGVAEGAGAAVQRPQAGREGGESAGHDHPATSLRTTRICPCAAGPRRERLHCRVPG